MSLYNEEMEASILGTLLYNNDYFYKATDILDENCFAEGANRNIYRCIKQLLDEGEKVSPYRLHNKFAELDKNYIATLPGRSKPITFRSDIKHLKDLGHRREFQRLCVAALTEINFFEKTGMDMMAELVTQTTNVMTSANSGTSVQIIEAMTSIYDEMASAKPTYAAKTGIPQLDYAMNGGLQKGRVYAFMAAPKVGKTMIGTTISGHLNQSGHKHLFVCAEMGSVEISQRILGHKLDVPSMSFNDKDNKELLEKMAQVIPTIKNNVIFEDVPGVEFDHLKSLVELHVHKNKIEGFILDYYQLVSGCEKNGTQAQHLENIANWIHRVCKRHKIWCILLVQTNDETKVLGSRGLNRACDQGYLIERPLDEQGDPIGTDAWLKLRFSRYTKTYRIGTKDKPYLELHKNGTHFEVKQYYEDSYYPSYGGREKD